ncbi:MAG: hypothetical protein PVI92_10635 [Chromatiales bacterium]|jgi:hypothetical protein
MSRYLQQLVQRATGQGPWATVVPARLPGSMLEMQRPGPSPVEPALSPSPNADMAPSGTETQPPSLSEETPGRVGQEQATTASAVPAMPDGLPARSNESISVEPSPHPPACPVQMPTSASEVPVSGLEAVIERDKRQVRSTGWKPAGSSEQPSPQVAQSAAIHEAPATPAMTTAPSSDPVQLGAERYAQPTLTRAASEPRSQPAASALEQEAPTTPRPIARAQASIALKPAWQGPHTAIQPPQDSSQKQPETGSETAGPPATATPPQTQPPRPALAASLPRPLAERGHAPRPRSLSTPAATAVPPAQARPLPPRVRVRIGKVEVRAASVQQQPAPTAAPVRQASGFDDYLALRSYYRQDY